MNQQQISLVKIRALDRDAALAPYLEANAAEFFSPSPSTSISPLTNGEITDWARSAELDQGSIEAVERTAGLVAGDPTLSFLFFHCSRLAYDFAYLYQDAKISQWPSLDPWLPGEESSFLLLVALSAVPLIQRQHRTQGIPNEITRATCSDIASRIEISREFDHGRIGVSRTCVHWLRHHVKGQLFQIGRLQFHPIILAEPIRVLRRISDGEVLLLAEPGLRFTADGFYDGAGGMLHDNAWFSRWDEADGMLTANRFTTEGRAEKQPVTIALSQWDTAVDCSSTVMNTHIPRGRKINLEEWNDSVLRGFEFFRDYRPVSAPAAACICRSWMFDPRLQLLLPETSGLVSLQRNVHLFPRCSVDTRNGFYFIFGTSHPDPERAPRDTTLRRALLDYIEEGGSISGGGMVMFEDQLRA